MIGEVVAVLRPVAAGSDPFGAPVRSWGREEVPDVLVAVGATSDLSADRPEGVRVAYTLAFPKPYAASLRGCRAEVRGEEFDVVGDPRPCSGGNCPTRWWMRAEVARTDG